MAPRRYFFRSTDGQVLGPVNLNTVAEMVQTGKVKANTPVSPDGSDFKPMKSFPELALLLSVDLDLPDASAADGVLEVPPTYSGNIQEVSFPKLMYHFTASKACGRLLLSNDAVRKEIFLLNGKPVAALSNLKRDRLSQHLLRKGVLQGDQIEAILQQLPGNEDRLSDVLIHRGLIKPHELFEHLREQLLEKIFEVFSWRVGTYAFFDGQEYTGSLLPLNLNPWEIIAQGVRMGYHVSELRQLLDPFRARILLPRDNAHVHISQLVLHPRELKVFKSITAGRTLGGILDRLGGDDVSDHVVLSMVYLGIELEQVSLGDEVRFEDDIGMGATAAPAEAPRMVGVRTGPASKSTENDLFSGQTDDNASTIIRTTAPSSHAEQALLETLNELQEQDHFTRLGLDRSASGGEVAKAFLKAARAYHPDQTPVDAPSQVRDLRSEIFSLLNEAQQTLSNDAKRKEYLAALEAGHQDAKVDVSHIVEAEMLFQKGELFLKARKYEEALEHFDQAIERNPEEGEFLIYRGFTAFSAKPNSDNMFRDLCIQTIQKGLKMRDNNVAIGYVFLGRIFAASNDSDKAEKMYRKALSIERNNVEASRELRLLTMRSEKKGGFWRKR